MEGELPSYGVAVKAVDEKTEEAEHSHRTSGHGGVAVIWKKELTPYMLHKKEEGNCRIQVLTCSIPGAPLCIINCYLPSGTSKEAVDTFSEDIDVIFELTEKYSASYEVVILGDLNADHYNRGNRKERLLQKLIADLELQDLGANTNRDFSYINLHLNHKSRLDHILVRKKTSNISWSDSQIVDEDDVINSSYHLPVAATWTVKEYIPKLEKKSATKKIFLYKELDTNQYQTTIQDLLREARVKQLPMDAATRTLENIITRAAEIATPQKTVRINNMKKKPWTPELASAVKHSKEIHFIWKEKGRPGRDSPEWQDRKEATRAVRRVQRRQATKDRLQLLQDISQALEGDQVLAHKLIRKQRQQTNQSVALKVDGKLTTDDRTIKEAWADYCGKLAWADHESDEEYLLDCMRRIAKTQDDSPQITWNEVDKAIAKLKKNKAADHQNLRAEHIQQLPEEAKEILIYLVNKIIMEQRIPTSLKSSYKLMIPKPGKDQREMDNYRGITIAPILLKVLEIICMNRELNHIIQSDISDLQVGFTPERSPSMASLFITETIAEARYLKLPLYVASLDARKAFDVVNHCRLKAKLFHSPISRNMWCLLDDLYVGTKENVRWNGSDSMSYNVSQGVKQGSIISPLLYKLYVNDLLKQIENSGLGTSIGTVYTGSPACADDVILMTYQQHQVQALLNSATEYATTHKYTLHPKKTVVTKLITTRKKEEQNQLPVWKIGESAVSIDESFVHLGLQWLGNTGRVDVQHNIQKARRMAYALLKTGLHGVNGLDPPAAYKIIQCYVTPKILHGIEAVVLRKEDILAMSQMYKKMLKQIQGLPQNTADEYVYLLIGSIPLEGQIHQKIMSLFGNICRLPKEHKLLQIGQRQLASRLDSKHSWFTMVDGIGQQYDLDIHSNLRMPKPKTEWKNIVKAAVKTYWERTLNDSLREKKTLQWYIPQPYPNVHGLWDTCRGDPRMVEAATCRARMLAGRFKTRELQVKYSDKDMDAKCDLCRRETETIHHLLIRCPALEIHRSNSVTKLTDLYKQQGVTPPNEEGELVSAILNGDRYISSSYQNLAPIVLQKNTSSAANKLCNLLCLKLARERDLLLQGDTLDTTLTIEDTPGQPEQPWSDPDGNGPENATDGKLTLTLNVVNTT